MTKEYLELKERLKGEIEILREKSDKFERVSQLVMSYRRGNLTANRLGHEIDDLFGEVE